MPRKQDSETDELRKLLESAERGDQTALPQLQEFLDAAPTLWQEIGNMALQAERALVNAAAGEDLLVKKSLERTMAEMRTERSESNPTLLEKLLVDRVVACWLQVHYADTVYAQNMKTLGIAWGEYQQRRQDRAHRRYLSAIRTLAQVRRLLFPTIQVNISENQINQQVTK